MLVVLKTVLRVVPFLAANIASIGPQSAGARVLLTTLVALRVTILVPLVALVVSLLGEIPLLPLVVEISPSLIPPGLPGTLCIEVAGLGLWLSVGELSRLVCLG